MKVLFRILVVLVAWSALVSPATGSTKAVAIPSTYYLPNLMPFGDATGNGTYQQVYDATRFPGTIIIRSLSFVPQDFGLPGFLGIQLLDHSRALDSRVTRKV